MNREVSRKGRFALFSPVFSLTFIVAGGLACTTQAPAQAAHPNEEATLASSISSVGVAAIAEKAPPSTAKNSTAQTAGEVWLGQYSFPSEEQLLQETGLKKTPQYNASVETLVRYLTGNMNLREKMSLARQCEWTDSPAAAAQPLAPSEKTLACLPLRIEQDAILRRMRNKKAEDDTPKSLVPITRESQWAQLADKTFTETFRLLKPANVNDLQSLTAFFRKTATQCQFRNVGPALIASAESLLPEPKVHALIEEIYERSQKCMNPADEGFERTHQRVGLLRLARSEYSKARQSLESSLRAADIKEDFRSLFWLGALAENTTKVTDDEQEDSSGNANASRTNPYWAKLAEKHPLSLHAILAQQAQGKDPMEKLRSQKQMKMVRRQGKGWTGADAASFVFELLNARNEAKAMNAWSHFVGSYVEIPTPEQALYFAFCHNKAGGHRHAISQLSRYLRDSKSDGLSLDFLKLYFPKPYSSQILSYAGNVDPVLVFALIRQESAFDPMARSGADARGLMQVIPPTARRYRRLSSASDLYSPEINIQVGATYLQTLMKKYEGHVERVLSAYNAGPTNIDRWLTRYPISQTMLFSDLIPFKETRQYVSIILRNAYWYGRLLTLQNDSTAKETIRKSNAAIWKSNVVHSLLAATWQRQPTAVTQLASLYSLSGSTKADAMIEKKEEANDARLHAEESRNQTLVITAEVKPPENSSKKAAEPAKESEPIKTSSQAGLSKPNVPTDKPAAAVAPKDSLKNASDAESDSEEEDDEDTAEDSPLAAPALQPASSHSVPGPTASASTP